MEGIRGKSYIEKNSSKLIGFSIINEKNKKIRQSNTMSNDKDKIISFNSYKSKIPEDNVRKSLNNKKSLYKNNNNFGFVPLFGKGLIKPKNNSNTILNYVPAKESTNISKKINSTIINNNINLDINSSSEESFDNIKTLKMVEKEIKNKILDMTTINSNNRSFLMDIKKNLNISLIEEDSTKKKRKKKKVKNKRDAKGKEENFEKDRKMVQKKPLYDSLDEEEIQGDDDDSDSLFINPEGRFIFILDTIILVSSFICFLYTPIQIAFSKCFCIEENIFIKIILICIDIIFISDFFVSFFRAFYNYEYKLIKNNILIIKNFIGGSFFIELLQAIPFNIIIIYFCFNKEKFQPDGPKCFYNGINGVYSSIKLLSGLKISKVLKAMNRKKNKAYLRLTEIDDHLFEKIYKLLSFTILSLLSINVFICLHIFIGHQTYPNWMLSMGIIDKPFIQIYIAALYGIIETLTTVGYGDVVCDSFTEIIFQIILLSIGIVAYSWLITIIGNYVKNESKAKIKHSKDLTMLEEIRVEFPKMSFKLYNKIHQHLQSVSNQQKKVDLNILVNSLPYSVKNMVLFRVYNKCIRRFIFFKKCDNTDFISRVLTNFIPLFSMKKALLIREGELIENIYFVKTGKLSLNVVLDPDDPEDSIKRYIYEKFEDIMDKDDKNLNKTVSVNNTTMNNNSNNTIKEKGKPNKFEGVNLGFQTLFNKRQTITGQSYHESRIEQEIGKCDLGGSEDIEEIKGKFLRVMDIKRNENFGTTYMLLNKPSPLSLRVISKKADIFLLRKHDVNNISKTYPSIWKKISEKAFTNMIAIKNKTIQILKNYCSYQGILLDDKGPKKNRRLDPINLYEIKELIELEKQKEKEENEQKFKKRYSKKKSTKKLPVKLKSNSLVLKKSNIIEKVKKNLAKKYSNETSNLLFLKSIILNKKKSCKYNIFQMKTTNINNNDEKITTDKSQNKFFNIKDILEVKENKVNEKNEEIEENKENKENQEKEKEKFIKNKEIKNKEISSPEKLNLEESKSSLESSELDETDKIYESENNKSFLNTLSNFPPAFASFLKKKIIKNRYKDKKYYKLMCIKLIDTLNNITKNNLGKNNEIKLNCDVGDFNYNENKNNYYNSGIYKNNNYFISNSSFVLPNLNKLNKDFISSLSKISQSNVAFDNNKLLINKNITFEIKSIYNNLNQISNGTYQKNKKIQKETENFVKFFEDNEFKKITRKSIRESKTKIEKENFFALLENLSEIKSNSNHEIKDKIKIKESSMKKPLKKYYTPKKIKKVKFVKPKSHINLISSSNRNKDSSLSLKFDNINNLETSENKMIKGKNTNGKKIYKNVNKSNTFIKKIFEKDKNDKENSSISKSNDILNDINILSKELDLRNTKNFEELRTKTLNKMKTDNLNKSNSGEKLNKNDELGKNNNNCIIF